MNGADSSKVLGQRESYTNILLGRRWHNTRASWGIDLSAWGPKSHDWSLM